jgi:selenide,water dikinase
VLELAARGCVPGGTRANLELAAATTRFGGVAEVQRVVLADAQTSGGLLLCVRPRRLAAVMAALRRHRTPAAAVVGRIVARRRPLVSVR